MMVDIRRLKSDRGGFSLMEVLVAVAIMAVAFTGILKLYSQSVSMNIRSRFYVEAPYITQAILGEWEAGMETRGEPFEVDDIDLRFSDYGVEMVEMELAMDDLLSEEKGGGGFRLMEVRCTVTLEGGNLSHTATLLKRVQNH